MGYAVAVPIGAIIIAAEISAADAAPTSFMRVLIVLLDGGQDVRQFDAGSSAKRNRCS